MNSRTTEIGRKVKTSNGRLTKVFIKNISIWVSYVNFDSWTASLLSSLFIYNSDYATGFTYVGMSRWEITKYQNVIEWANLFQQAIHFRSFWGFLNIKLFGIRLLGWEAMRCRRVKVEIILEKAVKKSFLYKRWKRELNQYGNLSKPL